MKTGTVAPGIALTVLLLLFAFRWSGPIPIAGGAFFVKLDRWTGQSWTVDLKGVVTTEVTRDFDPENVFAEVLTKADMKRAITKAQTTEAVATGVWGLLMVAALVWMAVAVRAEYFTLPQIESAPTPGATREGPGA